MLAGLKSELRSQRGSTILISLTIVGILLTVSLAVSTVVVIALRGSANIGLANQAFFAAEGGVENALYRMAGHEVGFSEKVIRVVIDPDDARSPRMSWELKGKTQDIPVEGAAELSRGLPRGGSLTLGMYHDAAGAFVEHDLILVDSVSLSLYANPDDGVDLSTVLPSDIRVTQSPTESPETLELLVYSEDTLAVEGDFDIGLDLAEVALSYVDLNGDLFWTRGEPVYMDLGDIDIGVVSAGDLRVNTVSPPFRTCPEVYRPALDPFDIEVLKGQCDTRLALAGIDNDLDGVVDDDGMVATVDGRAGIDDPRRDPLLPNKPLFEDGLVDEDPASWPLTAGIFFVRPLNCAAALESCIRGQEANNPGGLAVYADSPAVTVTIQGESGTGASKVLQTLVVTKSELMNVSRTSPHIFGSVPPDGIFSTLNDDFPLEPKVTIFALLKGIFYNLSAPDDQYMGRPEGQIISHGEQGPFRQTLKSVVNQVGPVPIFNYTVAF